MKNYTLATLRLWWWSFSFRGAGGGGCGSYVGCRREVFSAENCRRLCIGGILLIALELIPYLGFLVMILGSFWATGAALWSL